MVTANIQTYHRWPRESSCYV